MEIKIKRSTIKVFALTLVAVLGFSILLSQQQTVEAQTSGCSVSYDRYGEGYINSNTGATPGTLVVTNCTGVLHTYNGPTCPTTSQLISEFNRTFSGRNEFTPAPQPGQCQQIDFTGGGQGGGVCKCAGPAKVTCFKCTDSLNDGNACQSAEFDNSCPAGWSQNSNCAANAGGNCPVQEQTTCYRCTLAGNDGNACESITVNGNSCPAGYTTNSNCAQAVGGNCPTDTITCYSCTPNPNDGNTCEPRVYPGTTCPTGTSNIPTGCADAVGGSCQTTQTTCYRCTAAATDGDMCEGFVISGTVCPAGSSNIPNGCAAAVGGHCPICPNNICPPNTAFGDITSTDSLDNGVGTAFLVSMGLGLCLMINGQLIRRFVRYS